MRKLVLGIGTLSLVIACAVQSTEARPKYYAEFKKMYKDVEGLNDVKCNVCHKGKSKKDKNDYGIAYGTTLNAKNAKDADQIKKALQDSESKPSKIDGKTYGELLKANKLPSNER